MASRAGVQRYYSDMSEGSTSSRFTDNRSDHSHSTAPTSYGFPSRPSLRKYDSTGSRYDTFDPSLSPSCSVDLRDSSSTLASSIPSEEDFEDYDPEYEVIEYDERDYRDQLARSTVTPSSPSEFAELFPSQRRLVIRHDDTTLDGNMNLRVDTPVNDSHGMMRDVTLFHLRMHDLRNREFSLRRYHRDSGREVCNTRRIVKATNNKRPGLQRSVSNVLSSIRGHKEESKAPHPGNSLKRHDSGYDSFDEESTADARPVSFGKTPAESTPTKATRLEFSNYAHVNIKRQGSKQSKRYEFEYWGSTYAWKRIVKKNAAQREVSFQLVNTHGGNSIAYLVPDSLTPQQAAEEEAKGGWVPQCSMWINDPTVLSGLTDVAE